MKYQSRKSTPIKFPVENVKRLLFLHGDSLSNPCLEEIQRTFVFWLNSPNFLSAFYSYVTAFPVDFILTKFCSSLWSRLTSQILEPSYYYVKCKLYLTFFPQINTQLQTRMNRCHTSLRQKLGNFCNQQEAPSSLYSNMMRYPTYQSLKLTQLVWEEVNMCTMSAVSGVELLSGLIYITGSVEHLNV